VKKTTRDKLGLNNKIKKKIKPLQNFSDKIKKIKHGSN